jgi:hypothetical protein
MVYRRRRRVILGWAASLALVIGLSAASAGDFAADYSAPGSDSRQAQDLLEQRFPVKREHRRRGRPVDPASARGAVPRRALWLPRCR